MRDQEFIENDLFAAGLSIFLWVVTILTSLIRIFS